MGHIRLGRLPATQKWQQVVALLGDGAPPEAIADASADAAEHALKGGVTDPALVHSFWLLTQVPLAARAPDFSASLLDLGIAVGRAPSLLEIVGAFSDAVDRHAGAAPGRTDLGELAQHAAADSLTTVVGSSLPSLFEPDTDEVRHALGRFAARDQFARLARDFFARLTQQHLDYYLSRTLSEHVGPGRRFASVEDHSRFNAALGQHCREASRIVETFAGGWFAKTQFDGGITPEKAKRFVAIALKKIRSELGKRRTVDD